MSIVCKIAIVRIKLIAVFGNQFNSFISFMFETKNINMITKLFSIYEVLTLQISYIKKRSLYQIEYI